MLADHADSGQLLRDLAGRDRTHVADVLSDYEVGLEREDRVRVYGVGGPPFHRRERYRGVDRSARLIREVKGRSRDDGKRRRLGWVVALVSDRDDLVSEPEREQRLGRARQQRNDPHPAAASSRRRSRTCWKASYGWAPSTR